MTATRWQLRRLAKPDALHLDFEVDPADAPGKPVAMLRVLDTPEGLEVARKMAAAAHLFDAMEAAAQLCFECDSVVARGGRVSPPSVATYNRAFDAIAEAKVAVRRPL